MASAWRAALSLLCSSWQRMMSPESKERARDFSFFPSVMPNILKSVPRFIVIIINGGGLADVPISGQRCARARDPLGRRPAGAPFRERCEAVDGSPRAAWRRTAMTGDGYRNAAE